MKLITLSILLLLASSAIAQQITGIVKDKNGNTIPYVSVGIPSKQFGVTTNDVGVFKFNITNEKPTDTVRVSTIGYNTLILKFSELQQLCVSNTSIYLTPTVYELAAVTIRPNEYESKVLGNTNIAKLECENFKQVYSKDTAKMSAYKKECKQKGINEKAIGIEIGNKIKIDKGQQTFVDKIQFKTCTGINDTAIYRVNIYSSGNTLHKAFTPIGVVKIKELTNILKQPILVKTIGKTEVHNIDLSKQNIEVNDDFIVSLECIYASNLEMNIGVKTNMLGSTDLLIRINTMAEWVSIPLIDMTFVSVSVTQKKSKPFYKFW